MENANVVTLVTNEERFALKISAIKGEADAKESALLWTGRQVGKQDRKDLQLSAMLPQITAHQIAKLNADKVAIILNDEFNAYVRRVKCQRLNIGDAIELMLPIDADAFAELAVNMLSAPATRAKKLVSTASIRALLLATEYKDAALKVMGSKLDAWKRIGEKEMLPLCVAQDAKVATARATARDNAVIRCIEIAAIMPTDSEHKLVLEAAAELLAELETVDLDDSI